MPRSTRCKSSVLSRGTSATTSTCVSSTGRRTRRRSCTPDGTSSSSCGHCCDSFHRRPYPFSSGTYAAFKRALSIGDRFLAEEVKELKAHRRCHHRNKNHRPAHREVTNIGQDLSAVPGLL